MFFSFFPFQFAVYIGIDFQEMALLLFDRRGSYCENNVNLTRWSAQAFTQTKTMSRR